MTNYTNYTVHLNLTTFEVNESAEQSLKPKQIASLPVVKGPRQVAALAQKLIPNDGREHFGVFLLDTRLRVLYYHEVTIGTINSAYVHPREVFGPALRVIGVDSVVLVHNHPTGDPTPSERDVELTHKLVRAGRIVDVLVADHIVIGNKNRKYASFTEQGLLAVRKERKDKRSLTNVINAPPNQTRRRTA
jgi:DNA repair protein RadC